MKITVIGFERSALETAAHLSGLKHHVTCVSESIETVTVWRRGDYQVDDFDLKGLLDRAVSNGTLRFAATHHRSCSAADVVVFCVPEMPERVLEVEQQRIAERLLSIASGLKKGAVVVLSGKCALGTNADVQRELESHLPSRVDVASVASLTANSRVDREQFLVGARNKRVADVVASLAAFPCPPDSASAAVVVSPEEIEWRPEFLKTAASASDDVGTDIESRCETTLSCVEQLIEFVSDETSSSSPIRQETGPSSQADERILRQVLLHFNHELHGLTIALWGTDLAATGESAPEESNQYLVDALSRYGATLRVHSPKNRDSANDSQSNRITHYSDKFDASRGADALIILSAASAYTGVDPGSLRWRMKSSVIFDAESCLRDNWYAQSNPHYYDLAGSDRTPRTTRNINVQRSKSQQRWPSFAA